MSNQPQWQRFKSSYFFDRTSGFGLDLSRMNFDQRFLSEMRPKLSSAIAAMERLEKGAIANPDEKRMVGHYWLRDATRAPDRAIRETIEKTLNQIKHFAAAVHTGHLAGSNGKPFRSLLLIGIGGSALGPQFVTQALTTGKDPLAVFFFDNTDPDGMELVLRSIPDLASTLCVVISKSGGTKETRNGQLVAKAAFQHAGIPFHKHFVAVTGEGSELDTTAKNEQWLERFPMWDWVGGRTSELSAVGLLPAALQGFSIDEILSGARTMDALTRAQDPLKNPAALFAAAWWYAGKGHGERDMVILPYKDRLALFSRYLQQLVMESLGKANDLDGKTVNQGIAVYGNKGSTDQHAYVQQLREGLNNFYIVFIEALKDFSPLTGSNNGYTAALEVEPGITSGDYLTGFYLGTRRALHESNRESISITVKEVSAFTVGMLIALFERTVGLYASLININAYHQPGVEAGKKAAAEVLEVQKKLLPYIQKASGAQNAEQIAQAISADAETVFKVLQHLAENGRIQRQVGETLFDDQFSAR